MKKSVLFIIPLLMLSARAFAIPSFLTAQDIGTGNLEAAIYSGADHNGGGYTAGANFAEATYFDRQDTNIRLLYGIMERLDVYASYSSDTYPNFPQWGKDYETLNPGTDLTTKVNSANTSTFGLKYTINKAKEGYPMDIALTLGLISNSGTFNFNSSSLAANKNITLGYSGWAIGSIFSKKNGALIPYLSLGYGQDSTYEFKGLTGATTPSFARTVLFINIGTDWELTSNWAAALEYQIENFWWSETKFKGTTYDAGENSHSGLYLALKYKF